METFRRLGASEEIGTRSELEALATETDPNLYFEGLQHLAGRAARRDQMAEALRIWSFVAAEGAVRAPEVARRARQELEVLQGGGNFGRRIEFLSQRFFSEATSPSALIGMTVAGGVFTVGRSVLLARLLASPAGALTRGVGARAIAGIGAFAVEAPAFSLTTRTLRSIAGQESAASLGHDLLSSYLALGGLKIFGAAGSVAVRRAGAGPISRAIFSPFSSYLGILAGHGLEQAFGLRPAQPLDQMMTESLVILLQFHVGGRLASEAMGRRWQAWQAELNIRGETTIRLSDRWQRPEGATALAGFAMPHLAMAAANRAEPFARPQISMMVAKRPGSEYNDPRRSPPMPLPRDPMAPLRGDGQIGVMDHLRALRQAQQTLREQGEELSLVQILNRAIHQGRIPETRREELTRAVQFAKLYENSPILRERVREENLLSTETLVARLHELRASVEQEQAEPRYALATLVQALTYGGRLPHEKMRSFLTAAASFDLYLEHPVLARIHEKHFRSPYALVNALRPVRRRIEAVAERSYKLSTLIDALQWRPDFPNSLHQNYSMVAGASDFVGRLPRGRLRINVPQLSKLTPEQIYLRLLHLKPALRGEDGEAVSIGYLLMGLHSHGLGRVRSGRINESTIQNAYVIDMVLGRWRDWGNHFRNLSQIPKYGEGDGHLAGWRRPGYSRVYLLKENGQPYSDSRLSTMVRWGTFLWEHREALSLPTPQAVKVESLMPQQGSLLRDYLRPHWTRLKNAAPEDFFQAILEMRQAFRDTQSQLRQESAGQDGPSVPSMVNAFYKAQGVEPNGSLMTHAHQVEAILRRWSEWGQHFRRIADLPTRRSQGFSRSEYATEHLLRENGESFSRNTINSIVRWGLWLWEHRSDIRFPTPSASVPPPPSNDLE